MNLRNQKPFQLIRSLGKLLRIGKLNLLILLAYFPSLVFSSSLMEKIITKNRLLEKHESYDGVVPRGHLSVLCIDFEEENKEYFKFLCTQGANYIHVAKDFKSVVIKEMYPGLKKRGLTEKMMQERILQHFSNLEKKQKSALKQEEANNIVEYVIAKLSLEFDPFEILYCLLDILEVDENLDFTTVNHIFCEPGIKMKVDIKNFDTLKVTSLNKEVRSLGITEAHLEKKIIEQFNILSASEKENFSSLIEVIDSQALSDIVDIITYGTGRVLINFYKDDQGK